MSETETGGGLTVDHFRSVSAGGDDHTDNLVYACFRCNAYKADFFPNNDDIQQGRRILHLRLRMVWLETYLRELHHRRAEDADPGRGESPSQGSNEETRKPRETEETGILQVLIILTLRRSDNQVMSRAARGVLS